MIGFRWNRLAWRSAGFSPRRRRRALIVESVEERRLLAGDGGEPVALAELARSNAGFADIDVRPPSTSLSPDWSTGQVISILDLLRSEGLSPTDIRQWQSLDDHYSGASSIVYSSSATGRSLAYDQGQKVGDVTDQSLAAATKLSDSIGATKTDTVRRIPPALATVPPADLRSELQADDSPIGSPAAEMLDVTRVASTARTMTAEQLATVHAPVGTDADAILLGEQPEGRPAGESIRGRLGASQAFEVAVTSRRPPVSRLPDSARIPAPDEANRDAASSRDLPRSDRPLVGRPALTAVSSYGPTAGNDVDRIFASERLTAEVSSRLADASASAVVDYGMASHDDVERAAALRDAGGKLGPAADDTSWTWTDSVARPETAIVLLAASVQLFAQPRPENRNEMEHRVVTRRRGHSWKNRNPERP